MPTQLVGLAALGYGVYVRTQPGTLGMWDVLLDVVSSPQFVSFVLVPAWLIAQTSGLRTGYGYDTLIRCGSNRRTVLWACRKGLAMIIAALAVALIGIAVGSIGLPLASTMEGGSAASTFMAFQLVPLAAAVMQILLLSISLIAVQSLLVSLSLVTGRVLPSTIVAISVGTWVVFSSLGVIPQEWLFNGLYFLNLASVAAHPLHGSMAVVAAMAVLVGSYVLAAARDGKIQGATSKFASTRTALITVIVATGLLSATQAMQDGTTFWAAATFVFYGTPGSMIQYLTSMAVFAGFALEFTLNQSQAGKGLSELELVRSGSHTRWSGRILSRALVRAVAFLLGIGLVFLASYLMFGGTGFAVEPETALIVYQFLINGPLQIAFYLCLSFAVSESSGEWLGGAIALLVVLFLGYTPLGSFPGSPIGAASLGWVSQGWQAVNEATIGLTAGILFALTVLFTVHRHRRPSLVRKATT